jgi:hypothetical protein
VALIEANRVLTYALIRFDDWRNDLALVSSRAGRSHSEAERAAMLFTCDRIRGEVIEARAEIIAGLAETPSVRGHDRIVDVERALDEVDATIRALRLKLTG